MTATYQEASNYLDASGTPTDSYIIETWLNDTILSSEKATVFANATGNKTSGAYFDLPINTPPGGKSPDGTEYTYSANDCSVGDVDGDGEYEIILK